MCPDDRGESAVGTAAARRDWAEGNQEEIGDEGQDAPLPRRIITSASLPFNTSAGQPAARVHAHDLRPYSSVGGSLAQPAVKFAPNPVYEGLRVARQHMEESGSGLRHEVSNGSARFPGA